MKKERRPLTEFLLKELILKGLFILAIAYGVLFFFHGIKVFTVSGESWMNIFYLTEFAVLQCLVLVCVLYFTGSLNGKDAKRTILKRVLTFLPCILAVLFFILVFTAPKFLPSSKPDAVNFFTALAIFIGGAALGFLIPYGGRRLVKLIEARIEYRKTHPKPPKPVKVKKERRKKITVSSPFAQEGLEKAEPAPGEVFPDLLAIDKQFEEKPYRPQPSSNLSLKQICDGFNTYLESRHMYYTPETIRSFVAGMACSHFIILEGLSGTGKTSLPKYFSEYVGCSACFTPVQASWKDRSDILGYYNDFTAKFKETPFLRALYSASYRTDDINLMVLDEMNLSRVEYYFADFLSVLELDTEVWKIELMPVSTKGKLPAALIDGCSVKIPSNTWFIGTANKDDSTFTITDKVYDRAVIIDFSRRNEAAGVTPEVKAIHLGSDELINLFMEAVGTSDYNLSREDYAKFKTLSDFMLDKFEINFGNRIMNQIRAFVPVFVACGGTSAKAIDIMFSRKILRKLEGRFDDGLKAGLTKLEELVIELYGAEDFSGTLETIAKLKRKLL